MYVTEYGYTHSDQNVPGILLLYSEAAEEKLTFNSVVHEHSYKLLAHFPSL